MSGENSRVVFGPYRDIHPFRYVDRSLFFGRERVAQDLFTQILLHRLVVLFGESGAGKSSLLNAGLIPALEKEGLQAERIRVRAIPEQPILVERVAADESGSFLPSIFTRNEPQPATGSADVIGRSLQQFLAAVAETQTDARPVLILDQFEEVFTLFESAIGTSEETASLQRSILDAILRIVGDNDLPVKIMIGVRSDFLGRLEVLASRYPRVLDYRVQLQYLSPDEAKAAILRPFERETGNPFASCLTPGLAQRIVRDLSAATSGEGISPTQVQIICSRLWKAYAAHQPAIGEVDYDNLGGVKGILEGFLESELKGIAPPQLGPVAVTILGNLITSLGTRDVVGTEKLRGLVGAYASDTEFADTLQFLQARRLINSSFQRGTYFHEVASEYLIPPIRKENQQLTLERERAEAERKAQLERERAEKEAKAAQELRQLADELKAARDRAEEQAQVNHSNELLAAAISNLQTDPECSVLLALSAVGIIRSLGKPMTTEALDVLNRAVQASRVRLTLMHRPGEADDLRAVAFSPDGRLLATGGADQTAIVWDAASGQPVLRLSGHSSGLSAVQFSRDGTRLATASWDGTAKLWDTTTGRELLTLRGHKQAVYKVAFSPDGTRLATVGQDTAIVWDATTGQRVLTLEGASGEIDRVAFSPDGNRLATGGGLRTAAIWNAQSGERLVTLSGHTNGVEDVVFSPDGTRLATASQDSLAKVWDVSSGRELLTLFGHTNSVLKAAFDPQGKRLGTAGADGLAKIWDAASGRELFALPGHTNPVSDIAFSPDGALVATASWDGTARVWDIIPMHSDSVMGVTFSPDGTLLASSSFDKTAKLWDPNGERELRTFVGHGDRIYGLAFSPDGSRLATASDDRTAKVWEVATGKELLTLSGHTGQVNYVAFSPDGRRLATASSDLTAKIWDASSGRELETLTGHTSYVNSVAFSPDGGHLATGSTDSTVRIWSLPSRQQPILLSGHTNVVGGVAYSPDARRVASSSLDKTARVWDASTGKQLLVLRGHTNSINDVTFSWDGARLATASWDKTARIWDAASGQELFTFTLPREVQGVAFSPDGTRLAVGGEDRRVRVYVLDVDELVQLARRRVTRNLTTAECRKYLHTDTCPPP